MHQRLTAMFVGEIKNEKEKRRDPGRYASDARVARLLLFLDTEVRVLHFFNLSQSGRRSRPGALPLGGDGEDAGIKGAAPHGSGRRVRSEKHGPSH